MNLSPTHLDASMIPWAVVIGAAIVGACTDLRARRLPNALTLPLWLSGLAWGAAVGGIAGFAEALAASVLIAIPYVFLFLFAGGGAGDAKMMAGVGAWLGIAHGAAALVAVAVAGGLIGILAAVIRREGRALAQNLLISFFGLFAVAKGHVPLRERQAALPPVETMRQMPYGAAILAGVVVAAIGVSTWSA